MNTLAQDIRYALRMLRRRPGFTAVATVALALGIGANTTIFSLLNAVLIRPLPVSAPEELVGISKISNDGTPFHNFSYPSARDVRERSRQLDIVACSGLPISLNTGGEPALTYGYIVSGNYFDVLGIEPAAGRFFSPEEDRTAGTHPVVVISHALWQNRFNGDRAAIGRQIRINGRELVVTGVAPEDFKGTLPAVSAQVWIPTMMLEAASPGAGSQLFSRNSSSLDLFGRLKPGSTIESAKAELTSIQLALAEEFRGENSNEGVGVELGRFTGLPGKSYEDIAGFMMILMGVAGLVLLIACVNVSSMLLARAVGRRREIAIRMALGAGRLRLIRQLLVESTILFLIGGGVGVLIAFWTTDMLLAFRPPGDMPIDLDLSVDVRVLLFTLLVSLLCGTLFGLVPALPASRPRLIPAMKENHGGAGRSRLRDLFVVSQVALSLLLLVAAGLFLRTLDNAQSTDPGFEADDLYVMPLQPSLTGGTSEGVETFYRSLAERIERFPGVESVAFCNMVPLGLGSMNTSITYEGARDDGGRMRVADVNFVSPRFFRTLGMPILRGRDFTDADRAGTPRVAIINEEMAGRFWPGEDPIGKRVSQESPQGPFLEVVGIAKNAKYTSVAEEQHLGIYLPAAQEPHGDLTMMIRARPGAPSPLADARAVVRSIDPNLPVVDAMSMREVASTALLPQRLAATVIGIFGLLGLTLAAVGIYGLVAYTVAQRTHEIGIRAALGAQRRELLVMIMRQGFAPVLIGVLLGLAASIGLSGLLKSLLIGVAPGDPPTLGAVSILLLAIALLACYIPARRATRIDPMNALRYE